MKQIQELNKLLAEHGVELDEDRPDNEHIQQAMNLIKRLSMKAKKADELRHPREVKFMVVRKRDDAPPEVIPPCDEGTARMYFNEMHLRWSEVWLLAVIAGPVSGPGPGGEIFLQAKSYEEELSEQEREYLAKFREAKLVPSQLTRSLAWLFADRWVQMGQESSIAAAMDGPIQNLLDTYFRMSTEEAMELAKKTLIAELHAIDNWDQLSQSYKDGASRMAFILQEKLAAILQLNNLGALDNCVSPIEAELVMEDHPAGPYAVKVNGCYVDRGDMFTMMTRRDQVNRALRAVMFGVYKH